MTVNEEEYWDQVAHIEENNPSEPLLEELRVKYGPVQRAYLKLAMDRLPNDVVVLDMQNPERANDEFYLLKTREIREAYNLVRAIHNDYHRCQKKEEFAINAAKMQRAWSDVQRIIGIRSQYAETGQIPAETGEELPDNAVLLAKKLNSVRARITQTETIIREAAQAGDAEKVAKYEKKRAELITMRGLASQKLELLSNE